MIIFYAVVLFKSFEAFDRISVRFSTLALLHHTPLPPDLLMHCPGQCQSNPRIPRILNSVKLEGEISKSISS